jgi:hypothetical protein
VADAERNGADDGVIWRESWRADPEARPLADRHYNRQNPGAQQFVPPGSCCVLVAGAPVDALWITSAPIAEYVSHEWAGAWVCTTYRNERPGRRSSDLIREAIAASRALLGEVPELGMVTMIDERHVRPKRTPGISFLAAGFEVVGRTKERDLLVLRIEPEAMPEAIAPKPRRRREENPDQGRLVA